MTVSASQPRHSLRLKMSRDWPLIGATVTAFLSFIMLFPPWLTGGEESENAFGDSLQSAGPALIIVMAVATIALLGAALTRIDRRLLRAALVPTSILLAVYVVKVADVSELADLYNRFAEGALTTVSVSTGAGLWLGFVFALLTLLCVLLALGLKWGSGETLMYPAALRETREPRDSTSRDAYSNYPPRPKDPPDAPHGPSNG
ncbi:hypothetical protein [Streptomyces sp. 11x1]|uniref:hypothetical protein n=1 Tax=Streptomyces sp. 11x1 TaxID=3038642 RepID=UPI00292EAF51|nr:hypothetical protein [Streptomyces sp. 11x1]WNZ06184.1 hypothetical protein P8T65_00285 [Streptomyces sp. 11x1]